MILAIGEVLMDLFPDRARVGGAPFNFSAHLASLGFPVTFASRVGHDAHGQSLKRRVRDLGLPPGFIQEDPHRPTGHVRVTLDDAGSPSFDIVRGVAYDELEWTPELARTVSDGPEILYFGTLIQRSASSRRTLRLALESLPGQTRRLCDLNLRPGCHDDDTIRYCLDHADILKLNHDELAVVKRLLGEDSIPDRDFLDGLLASRDMTAICVTRGDAGLEWCTRDGFWRAPAAPPPVLRDTVGAGDACAAVLAAGLLKNWPPALLVERASALAGAVCGLEGALPDDPSFYRTFTNGVTA